MRRLLLAAAIGITLGVVASLQNIGGLDTFHAFFSGAEFENDRREGISDGFFTELVGWLLTILIGFVFVQLASIFTKQSIHKESNYQLASGLVRRYSTFLDDLVERIDVAYSIRVALSSPSKKTPPKNENAKNNSSLAVDDHHSEKYPADNPEHDENSTGRYPDYENFLDNVEQFNQFVRANKALSSAGSKFEDSLRSLKPYWIFAETVQITKSGKYKFLALHRFFRESQVSFSTLLSQMETEILIIAKYSHNSTSKSLSQKTKSAVEKWEMLRDISNEEWRESIDVDPTAKLTPKAP